jgi:UDP-GlcNAc:undecaprenyl-phosphate GlcNAc-1-phosphate transferase
MIATGAAFAVALLLGALAVRLGPAVGARDRPAGGALEPDPTAIPWLGGAAIVGGLIAGLAAEGWPLPWAGAVAIGAAFVLGLAGDVVGVPPVARLAIQVTLGLVVAAGGLAADVLPGTALAWIVGAVIFAAALHAVSMVDGMDGLAATAGAISALGLALVAARSGHEAPMLVALVTAGAVAGFLVLNLPPARLFLGDNGAYALAAALAVVVLSGSGTAAGLVGSATCLGLFVVDLLLALLRRVVVGTPLTAGERHHVYDQLQARGLSARRTLFVCGIVHVAFVAVGVRASATSTAGAVATVAAAWTVTIVWLLWSGLVTAGVRGR